MALPFSLSSTTTTSTKLFRVGSAWYTIGRAASPATAVAVYKSTAPDTSWTEQDSSNRPSAPGSGTIQEADAYLDGTDIICTYHEGLAGGSSVYFNRFSTSTDTWVETNTAIETTSTQGTRNFVRVRSDGDWLVAYNGAPDTNMGTSYTRADLARNEGAGWTTGISLGVSDKTAINESPNNVLMTDADRFHVWFGTSSSASDKISTYKGDNTFGQTNVSVTSQTISETYNYNDGTSRVRYLLRNTGATPDNVSLYGANDSDTIAPDSLISSTIVPTSGNDVTAVQRAVVDSSDNIYVVYARTSDDIYCVVAPGSDTFGSSEIGLDVSDVPNNPISIALDETNGVIGVVYFDSSNFYYYNEITVSSSDALLADDISSATSVSSPTVGQEHSLNATDISSATSVSSPTLAEITSAVWDQDSFRFRNDDGAHEAATWWAAANTNPTDIGSDTPFRLRYLLQETAGSNQSETPNFQVWFRFDTGSGFGGWAIVGAEGSGAQVTRRNTANITNGTATSQQIGAGTFRGGRFKDTDAFTGALTATQGNDEYEVEFSLICPSANVSPGDGIEIRIYESNNALTTGGGTYTNTASFVIAAASDNLLADDISSATSVSAPAVGQEHTLLADDLASATTVSSPAVGQEHSLDATDISSATSVSAPSVGQEQALLPDDVSSATSVSAPSVGQEHALLANDVSSATSVSAPALADFAPPKVVFYASTGSISIPFDFDGSGPWSIEVIGAGQNGGSTIGVPNGGGGGGAYAKITDSDLTLAANDTCYVSIAAGGSSADTWFNATTNSAPGSTSAGALAKAGSANSGSTGGAGGSSASSIGSTKYAGGSGGNGGGTLGGGGGGGSAAGPNGAGANGGGGATSSGTGGGGGGGANNGSAGGAGTSPNGGAGGNNRNSTGGGTGATTSAAAGAGTSGGGGGAGAGSTYVYGANGSQDSVWTQTSDSATAGPGGGGGGGGSPLATNGGGNGGGYGGGGGGPGYYFSSVTAGSGTGGIVVLTYTPASADDLLANDISSATSVSSPAIGQEHSLNATDISSATSVSSPAVGQEHAILADDISSATSASSPAVGQEHGLTADDLSSATSVSAPTLTDFSTTDHLFAEDISSATSVSSPSVGQEHELLADDLSSATSVTSPAIGQEHAILADDISSATSVSSPAVGQEHAVLADDVSSATSVSSPAVGQEHAVLADDVSSVTSVSTPSLGQEHAILANDISSATSVTAPTLTDVAAGTDALLADDIASATSVSTPNLGQEHAILADDLASATSVSTPAVGQHHELTATGVSSATSVSSPSVGIVSGSFDGSVKDGGVWKPFELYVKDGGVWKPAAQYVKDGGTWKVTS